MNQCSSSAPSPSNTLGDDSTEGTAGEVVAWVIGWGLLLGFALGVTVVARSREILLVAAQDEFVTPSHTFPVEEV